MWLNLCLKFHTMAAAVFCAITVSLFSTAAALSVSPDRSKFFTIEMFTVRCPSDSWTVWRNTTHSPTPSSCARPWGKPLGLGCRVGPTLTSDTGLYWCQDKEQENSSPVSITVTDKFVILESPAFPVMEGEQVTLNCSYKPEEHLKSTSNFEAVFFQNNEFIGKSPNGTLIITEVFKTHEGLYKCEHLTSKEQSLASRLIVQDRPPPLTTPSTPRQPKITIPRLLCFVLLFVLYTVILFIALTAYRKWAQVRAEEKQQASERVSLRRIRNP